MVDYQKAIAMLDFSMLALESEETLKRRLKDEKNYILHERLQYAGLSGYIAYNEEGQGVIAFKPTDRVPKSALLIDLWTHFSGLFIPIPMKQAWIHGGYWFALRGVMKQIINAIESLSHIKQWYFTGHSLGGACALVALWVAENTCAHCKDKLKAVYAFGPTCITFSHVNEPRFFTFINEGDPVPHFMPGLKQAEGNLFSFDEDGNITECSSASTRWMSMQDIKNIISLLYANYEHHDSSLYRANLKKQLKT